MKDEDLILSLEAQLRAIEGDLAVKRRELKDQEAHASKVERELSEARQRLQSSKKR